MHRPRLQIGTGTDIGFGTGRALVPFTISDAERRARHSLIAADRNRHERASVWSLVTLG